MVIIKAKTTTDSTPNVTLIITHQGHCSTLVITDVSPVPENNWNKNPKILNNPLKDKAKPIPSITPRIIETNTIDKISNSTSLII